VKREAFLHDELRLKIRLSILEEEGLSDAHFPLGLGIGPCNVG
jgi:hypothetical protein